MPPFNMKQLATRVRQRREDLLRDNPIRKIPIDDTMSRILEHDEGYISRVRTRKHKRPPLVRPGIGIITKIATSLETTPDDLLGLGRPHITTFERRRIREFVRYLTETLQLEALDIDVGPNDCPSRREGCSQSAPAGGPLTPSSVLLRRLRGVADEMACILEVLDRAPGLPILGRSDARRRVLQIESLVSELSEWIGTS